MEMKEKMISFKEFEAQFAGWDLELISNRWSEVSPGVWVARLRNKSEKNIFANMTKEMDHYSVHVYTKQSGETYKITEWIEIEPKDSALVQTLLKQHANQT
ncbi:MAG TPA: hypothetical protein V6C65_38955 [Allocoleopsis sp.]